MFFNSFFKDLFMPLIYHWISNLEGAKITDDPDIIEIEREHYLATIGFYKNNILELSIKDKISKGNVFYLHFIAIDFRAIQEAFNSFFKVLDGDRIIKKPLKINRKKMPRLLLTCSGGITTNYFANVMKIALAQIGIKLEIDAVGIAKIDEEFAKKYDYILLAPQVGYFEPQFRQWYGKDRVKKIDPVTFATNDVEKVLELLDL